MSPSKDQEYLKTIKAKHKIHKVQGAYEYENLDDAELFFKHLRRLKSANRLSSNPIIQSYSVAEHCYYTGLLFMFISHKENISVSQEEILWVFRHDVLESVTGDLLLPVKAYNPKTKKYWEKIEEELVNGEYHYLKPFCDKTGKKFFTEQGWNLFKIVDLLELWLFCKEEILLGNGYTFLKVIIKNCENLIFPYKFRYVNDILGGVIPGLWK